MIEKWHVTPNSDLFEHIESENCECEPRIQTMDNGNKVIIHNSYDGRDLAVEIGAEETIVIEL